MTPRIDTTDTNKRQHSLSAFVLVAFALSLTGEYLAELGMPRVFSYLPELCGIAAAILTISLAVSNGFAQIRPAVWIVLVLLGLHLLFGMIANGVQVGTAIVGARIYLRCIPFFLLAIVLIPNARDLTTQFRLLLVIGLAQVPIAIHQRMATMQRVDFTSTKYLTTGDLTYGTFMNPAILSLFLICLTCVVFTAYLHKRISLPITLGLIALLLFPTTINETKATFFLIPIAFLVPVLIVRAKNRKRNVVLAISALSVFFVAYVVIYDYLMMPRWGYGFLEFLTMEGRIEDYLSKGAEVGTTGSVGRIDSLVLPFTTLQSDPVKMLLGLGMGSVTQSAFGDQYTGEYFLRYGALLGPTVSRLTWEIGVIGLLLVFTLLALIFDGARRNRLLDGPVGILSQSWIAVVPLMIIGMFYKELMSNPAISIPFWYYSGAIVAFASARPDTNQSLDQTPAPLRPW